MPLPHGFPIVLTADRTLVARYRALFDGMMSASQTTTTPAPLMRALLAPAVPSRGLRAAQAPLGLRRVEAALVRDGWGADQVAVVRPEDLPRAIGRATRIVGISSGDPLGLGMNSNTMAGIAGGEIYASRWFRALVEQINRLRAQAPHARLVAGGPGAWQLAQHDAARRALGIDHVVCGYCEADVANAFRRMAHADNLPELIDAASVSGDAIPPLLGPTVMGAVEISRGCGLGCGFCTIGRARMIHLSPDTILADVRTNLDAGATSIALITEDLLRYRASGAKACPSALIELLGEIARVPGLRLLQSDHANIASVEHYSDAELAEVHRLLAGDRGRYVWLNVGVETASGRLLADNGGRPKMGGHAPEEWADLCREQVLRLVRAGFFPFVSLVMGMSRETDGDVEQTVRWVEALRGERLAVFPMFLAPIDGRRAFGVADMTPAHWRLFRRSYEFNFKWTPRLAWDHQRRAGVPLAKRLLVQTLGRGQVWWWKAIFAWRSGRLFA